MRSKTASDAADPMYQSIRRRLESLKASINREIRSYPPPIAGCDQQFNKLLDDRRRVTQELRRLDDLYRQGTVREADIQEIDAFLKSTAHGPEGRKEKSDRTPSHRAASS